MCGLGDFLYQFKKKTDEDVLQVCGENIALKDKSFVQSLVDNSHVGGTGQAR